MLVSLNELGHKGAESSNSSCIRNNNNKNIDVMIGRAYGSTGLIRQLVRLLRPRVFLPLALTRLVCPKQPAWQDSSKVGCSKPLVPLSSSLLHGSLQRSVRANKLKLSCRTTIRAASLKDMLLVSWFWEDWSHDMYWALSLPFSRSKTFTLFFPVSYPINILSVFRKPMLVPGVFGRFFREFFYQSFHSVFY